MAQRFLRAGQHGLFIASLNIDDAVRRQASLGQRGREQILPGANPENGPPGTGRDPGAEQGSGGSVDASLPATGQPGINRRQTKGQNAAIQAGLAFNLGDLRTQGRYGGRVPQGGLQGKCSPYVLF